MDNITVIAKEMSLEQARSLISTSSPINHKFEPPFHKVRGCYHFGIVPMNVNVGDCMTMTYKNKLLKKKIVAIGLDGCCEFFIKENRYHICSPEGVKYKVIAIQPKLYFKKLESDFQYEGNVYFAGSVLYRYGYEYKDNVHFTRIFVLWEGNNYWYLNGCYIKDGWIPL